MVDNKSSSTSISSNPKNNNQSTSNNPNNSNKRFEIKAEQVVLLEKIDEGGQGEVYSGKIDNQQEVIIKVYKKIKQDNLQEVKVYQLLEHELMVKFFGCFINKEKKLNIVLERAQGLSLDHFILLEIDSNNNSNINNTNNMINYSSSFSENESTTTKEDLIDSKNVTDSNNTINHFSCHNNSNDNDNYKKTLSLKDKLIVINKVCNFLIYLRKKNVIHRDLKPSNIMITKNKIDNTSNTDDTSNSNNSNSGIKLKIFDFGISKISDKTFTYTVNIDKLTVNYSAPEMYSISEKEKEEDKLLISNKIDIWALGCIISYIFTGVIPWTNKSRNIFRIQYYLLQNKPFPIPENWFNIPSYFKDSISKIISLCLKNDPNERINAFGVSKLVECLIKDEDFDKIYSKLGKEFFA